MEYRDGRLTRVADSPGNYVILVEICTKSIRADLFHRALRQRSSLVRLIILVSFTFR
jgi:hypothetical protein